MKKWWLLFPVIIGLFLFQPVVRGQVQAASLKFDRTAVQVNSNDTFSIGVIVDAGTDQIKGADAYVLFDSTLLQYVSASDGTMFTTVIKNQQAGKVILSGLEEDPTKYKTGQGTLATITFRALRNGTGTLTFDCSTNTSTVVKSDFNSPNILVCTDNNSATITVGTGSSGLGSTVTPSVLPRTGAYDNMLKVGIPGLILFFIGGGVRLFVRRY